MSQSHSKRCPNRRKPFHGCLRSLTVAFLLLGACLPEQHAFAQTNQTNQANQTNQPTKPNQTDQPDEFPPSPLELKTPDPLLPTGADKRSLTDAERKQLVSALDELNAQATAQLRKGDRLKAFDTWNRELRLRRYLGLIPELQALGRVGDIAWKENEITEVRWITQRLDAILAEAQKPPAQSNMDTASRTGVLEALGVAYQQVRSPGPAIMAYQQVLTEARERKDSAKVETTLQSLGQLHLSWFDYPKAAEVYNELLTSAKARGDRPGEITYVTQLAYTYEQAKQPEPTISYQQQLVDLYQQSNQPAPIPALKIKIGDNYQLLSQPTQAEQNYQAAYKLAQPLLQFGYASNALEKLGNLYRSNNRLDAALRVYEFLVAVEQQAYNVYGMMHAYDEIGQINLSRKAYPQAIAAFQRGLQLARQLKYREDYFTAQIKQAQQGSP